MTLAKSNKLLSADVKQEWKIAQWTMNRFSSHKQADTVRIPESVSQVCRKVTPVETRKLHVHKTRSRELTGV